MLVMSMYRYVLLNEYVQVLIIMIPSYQEVTFFFRCQFFLILMYNSMSTGSHDTVIDM